METSLGAQLVPANVGYARVLDSLPTEAAIASATLLTPTAPGDLPIGTTEFSYHDHHRELRVGRIGADAHVIVDYWSHGPELSVYAAAPTHKRAEEILLRVLDACGPLPEVDEGVRVTFWAWNERFGAQARRRVLDAGRWETMRWNYPGETRDQLETLMGWTEGPGAGQLMLLYGPPGTGKTHAIRALTQAWRSWCDVSYVVDPERFFGSADYMLSVLMDDAAEDDVGEASPRWQLVVVEDTDELIRSDGKERSGQSMSRLLNLCDGLIGQGLRVLVLLTTNEPIDALHPAIMRPGRCAARIEAGPFPADEARAWLRAHDLDDAPEDECTLAELYLRLRDQSLTASARPIGF